MILKELLNLVPPVEQRLGDAGCKTFPLPNFTEKRCQIAECRIYRRFEIMSLEIEIVDATCGHEMPLDLYSPA